MNRLIIIGNGFDLAHNMQTSYSDFLFWYLKECMENCNKQIYKDELITLTRNNHIHFNTSLDELKNIKTILEYSLESEKTVLAAFHDHSIPSVKKPFSLKFSSKLFEDLILCYRDSNWVDIERHYYLAILKILEKKHADENSKKNRSKEIKCFFSIFKSKITGVYKFTKGRRKRRFQLQSYS